MKNNLSAFKRRVFSSLNAFKRNNKTGLNNVEEKKHNLLFLLFFCGCEMFGIEAPSQLQELLQGGCYKEVVKVSEKGREENETRLKWMCGLCSSGCVITPNC